MRLMSLCINNFKGLERFNVSPGGATIDIYGTNATGKTTIMDALIWLLTDKDSQSTADFTIKPASGYKKGAFTEVEAVFDLDGRSIALKKIYRELWTKKRGSSKAEFTGHTTDYFVNGVPEKLKGYTKKIEEIVDIEKFKPLTNIRYFCEEMKWQDRRKILVEAFGNISVDDVVSANPDVGRIVDLLGDKTPDELRAEIHYRRKGINDELKIIPARIDERQKSLPDEAVEVGGLGNRKADLDSRLSVLRNQLSMIESGGSIGTKKAEIQTVENEIREHEALAKKKANAERERRQGVERFCKEKLEDGLLALRQARSKLSDLLKKRESIEITMDGLRAEWLKIDEESFAQADTCPTCGQKIPETQQAKALEKYNLKKAETLSEISTAGGKEAKNLEAIKKQIFKLEKDIEKAETDNAALQKEYTEAVEAARTMSEPTDITPEHAGLINKKTTLEGELSELQLGTRDETSDIYAEISEIEKELAGITSLIATAEEHEKTRKRIGELLAEEKRLTTEIEQIESDLVLIEDFIRAQCNMLTGRINKHFQLVEWVLFEDQLNGGIKDVCIAAIGGVPYHDLNNAMKINCGIDIINTLSDHYGVRLPIFVDNAESVVDIISTENQLIRLIVSEQDKKLRIETAAEKAEAA
jgi:DNA repair exonuclease SbcCD ATPase subunit